MKKFLVLLIVIVMSMIVTPSFAAPSSITLDSAVNSGDSYSYGLSFFFEPGAYEFSVVSGGWNAWAGSTGVTGCDGGGANCATGWMWSMDIYQPSTSTYYRLGSKIDRYANDSLALGAHATDSLSLNLASGEDLWFFVKDGNLGDGQKYVGDNSGSVTVAVAPEPVSTILFLTGSATLGVRGWIRRKRQSV